MLYQVDGYEVDLSNSLGQGTFGRVYPCRQSNSQQFDLCCKAICIESLKKNEVEYQKTLRETQIMAELKEKLKSNENENVVKFYHTAQVIFENQEHILLFMERCDTDLKEYLKKTKVSIADAVGLLKQIINGYRICYENSIVHRDIKPANILMKGNICKLTDFGEGKIVKEIDKILQQTKSGTPIYQSPQMFTPSKEVCSAKTDIFSLGVMFYEILYASLPFAFTRKAIEDFHLQLSQKTYNPPNINHSNQPINQQIIDLLKRMLIYSDNDRIGWKELFDHPLIKIAVQEQQDIKKSVMNNIKLNNLPFKPAQIIPQRLGTMGSPKMNIQPINGQIGQIPQTQNIGIQQNIIINNGMQNSMPNNGTIPQQLNPNFYQQNRQTIQTPLNQNPIQQNLNPIQSIPNVSLQRSNQQFIQAQSNIPTIGINNSVQIKNSQALDSQIPIIALKFLNNFMNQFEKYGNTNPSVCDQVDQVVRVCKQMLSYICNQILLKQQNQICDEQFKTLKNAQEILQVQIFIEYSQKAKEGNPNYTLLDLGNQLKQIIERVYQFFPFDKNKNYKESYVNLKINMKLIIQEQIKFTDLSACNFRTPNESYLY